MPFAAGVYAVLYILTLTDALTDFGPAKPVAVAGLAVFVVLEAPRIRPMQRFAAMLLGFGGLAAAYWSDGPAGLVAAAYDGFYRALPFMVLFAAVMSLQRPAVASPSFRAIGESVVRQPPGRRFLMLAFAGHYLGAVLNLAGLQLVTSLLDPSMSRGLRERLTVAVLRGFSVAVVWSPFFVGMGVILTLVPGVSWLSVAPAGLPLGAALILLAWAFDRLTRRRTAAGAHPPVAAVGETPAPSTRWLRPALGVTSIFLALAAPVVALSEAAGVSIVIALGLIAPPLALAWQWRLARTGATRTRPAKLLHEILARLPDLRNEAALFLGATLFGVGLSAAIDPAALGRLALAAELPVWVKAPVLATAGTLVAGLGVHPVVLAIVVGAVLTPQVLGMPAAAVALLLAVIWAFGTQMSPFSATVMQVSRQLDVPVFRVAWVWNAPFCLPAAAVAGLAVAAASAIASAAV